MHTHRDLWTAAFALTLAFSAGAVAQTFNERFPTEQLPPLKPVEQAPQQTPSISPSPAAPALPPASVRPAQPQVVSRPVTQRVVSKRVVRTSPPRSRLVVVPRTFLDTGTEVSPGERKFTDYALPPTHIPMGVVTNTGGRTGWHNWPLPGPFFPIGPGS